ncbi:hypothetical protein HY638_02790 [Candidatus Woesearchaeota archaeon]|nr:hypothetical protein [Candidatus Woesearchaeota archaeon]
MYKLIRRGHWTYILAFLILTAVFYWDGLSFSHMIYSECPVAEIANFKVVQEGIKNWDFPLWMPNYHGGVPFFANAQNAVLHYNVLLGIISPTFQGGCNLGILVNTFLAGVFMFYLALYLGLKERNALISGVIYMFSGFAITHAITIQSRYSVYAWVPMIFLAAHKALNSEMWIRDSIIAGVVLAVVGHSSGLDFFLYAVSVILPIICAMHIFGKDAKGRIVRVILFGLVVFAVFFGLMAVRVLPLLEWGDVSSKGQGFSYEESIGGHLQFNTFEDFYSLLINPPNKWVEHASYASLGPIAIILLLFSIPLWKRKTVLTFVLIAAAGFLIGAGTYLYYPIWRFVPGISAGHHVDRFLFLYQFGISVLAGFGSAKLFEFAERKFPKLSMKMAFSVIVILLFLSSAIFSAISIYGRRTIDIDSSLKNNQLLNYLSEQEGVFRIHNIGTQTIAGFAGMYAVFRDLEILYGTSPIWIYDYLNEYLSVAYTDPAKFYGMLNTRYIYSESEIKIPGLNFVGKFDECSGCLEDHGTDKGIDGPYLYENLDFLPRAYFPEHSILIVGDYGNEKGAMYGIMRMQEFYPAKTVIIIGESPDIAAYDDGFLGHFDAVLLVDGVKLDNVEPLSAYMGKGGKVLPNVAEGKTSVSADEIASLLKGFGEGYDANEAKISEYGNDIRKIDVEGKRGFLQLAEKFYLFPDGWRAHADGKEREILRSNGVNSAIWVDGEKELVLGYEPDSFETGKWITIGTIAVLIFLYVFHKRKQ